MLKKLKTKWIAVLLILASLFVFAGCSLGFSLDDLKEEYNLEAQVTYYANGGRFENSEGKVTKDMYYKADSKAVNIGSTEVSIISGSISIGRDNYDFAGWYFVTLENGEPKKDDNGNIILGDKVDFSVRLQKGDHWHVAAKWNAKEKLNVYLSCETTVTLDGKDYTQGSLINEYNFGVAGAVSAPTIDLFKDVDNITYLDYYYDEACTQPVVWPVENPNDGTNVSIYVKYIVGEWKVLRATSDVKLFFANGMSSASNHYCLSRDLDLGGESISLTGKNLACEFEGFGFTIKNFKLERKNVTTGNSVSVFGDVKATAKLKNVKFENVDVSYSFRTSAVEGTFYAYLFSTSIATGATLENVTFDATLKIDAHDNSNIINMPKNGDVYSDSNWKFGGFATDAECIAAYPGITITDGSSFEIV